MRKTALRKKPKRDRLRILHKKAWDLWSIYIRKRDNGVCFTCGKRDWNLELGEPEIRSMQAGHFIHNVLDFDPMNINCQCSRCNHYLSGNGAEYSIRLIRIYGLKAVEDLHNRASMALKGEKRSEEDYLKLISDFQQKIKELEGKI